MPETFCRIQRPSRPMGMTRAKGWMPSRAPSLSTIESEKSDRSDVGELANVEQVWDDYASVLGHDRIAYRNHVYRVVNLFVAVAGDNPVELERLAIAAVFHDLDLDEPYVRLHRSVSFARARVPRDSRADGLDSRGRSDDRQSPQDHAQ